MFKNILNISLMTILFLSGASHAQDCKKAKTFEECYNSFFKTEVSKNTSKVAADTRDTATAGPSSFAGDVHASYEDFLNPFSFAINEIGESEDGRSLIVRLNKVEEGRHSLGLTLTVKEPQLVSSLSDKIPATTESGPNRDEIIKNLGQQQGDLDDLTWTLGYSYGTGKCSKERILKERSGCWGRSEEAYEDLLSSEILGKILSSPDESSDFYLVQKIAEFVGNKGLKSDLPSSDTPERAKVVELLREAAQKHLVDQKKDEKIISESGIKLLGQLIANQPQFTFKGSYRDPGELGGQEELGFELSYQRGGLNLNRLFRDNDNVSDALQSYLNQDLKDNRFTFSATYLERDAFTLNEVFTVDATNGERTTVPGFLGIELEESSEFCVKAQWGRKLKTEALGDETRLDVSVEGFWTDNDAMRSKNRWVATATLTIPLVDKVDLPISLKYSDNPEFLTDLDEQIDVHFGISYRFPWEKKKAEKKEKKNS